MGLILLFEYVQWPNYQDQIITNAAHIPIRWKRDFSPQDLGCLSSGGLKISLFWGLLFCVLEAMTTF